jgi:hypothetical protein
MLNNEPLRRITLKPLGGRIAVINKGFLRHGIFLEGVPIKTLVRYQNYKAAPSILDRLMAILPEALRPVPDPEALIAKFIEAMNDMSVKSVWIQLFNTNGELDAAGNGATSALVSALKSRGIAPVGWGYCYSKNATSDLDLAMNLCGKYGFDAFVADVEPGNTVHGQPDNWDPAAFKTLIKGLSTKLGIENLAVSTFASMTVHSDALPIMRIAKDYVCMFAPQVYWFNNDPASYARSSIASWRTSELTTPLVATAQSYWDKIEGTPSQAIMEEKVQKFIDDFSDGDFGTLIGLNWYHAGGANSASSGAMSDSMISSIAAGHINDKPFADTEQPA